MWSVGNLELYLSVCVADMDSLQEQSCPSKNSGHNINLPRRKEGMRERQTHTEKELSWVPTEKQLANLQVLLHLTSQHRFTTCIQCVMTAHIVS